ncbi:hypothetical protein [Priestia megaterium]|uniref:hypothetical protein n=1 Tax=Priestia megaterium TaxID=1404 RepID=UPI000BEBAC5D|nr:hypothetical protein [Priestia megaterium]MED4064414.1 hypothetical protein [Priestia megaterium]PEA38458.1 hypothetical protein CON45_12685 [Priestia megaterium]
MNDKQKYKQFTINSPSDYIVYLRHIIIQSHKWMKRYDKHLDYLSRVIDELDLENNEKLSIDSEIYDEHNDKIQYANGKLVNLYGDLASGAMSYYKFRKTLLKRNTLVKSKLGELSEEVSSALKDFNIARNWGMHQPESLLNAHLENIGKLWKPQELKKYRSVFNPIWVPYFKEVEGKWLLSLYEESTHMNEGFKIVYNSMISDYSKLVGAEAVVKENHVAVRPFESEFLLPKTSMEMQRGVYKK